MRFSLITGRPHDSNSFSVVVQPGDPREVGQKYKLLLHNPGDLAEIQLWESLDGITQRRRFAKPKAFIPPRVVVPTLEEVLKTGYSEDAAKSIIADVQAQADAVAANPDISDEDLANIKAIPPTNNNNTQSVNDTEQAAESPSSDSQASGAEQPASDAQPGAPSLIPGDDQPATTRKKK